jgi:hypothetical protein
MTEAGIVDPINGYVLQSRDLAFLGYTDEQLGWWRRGEAPMGMTPQQFHDFRSTLEDALRQDGISPDAAEVYLKGSSVTFFANKRKALPTRAELADKPAAAARLVQWLGDDPNRPQARMFDAMHKLGLEKPSDVDLVFSSDEMVRKAWQRYTSGESPGIDSFTHPKYQFIHKVLMQETFPSLADWADRWHDTLGREVTPAVFGLQHEPLEPDDIEAAQRWQVVGPAAFQEQLRISPPELNPPPENAVLRVNQQSGIDKALIQFLDSSVNLSDDAYRELGSRVGQVQQAFDDDALFGSHENRLYGQGSCFYGTAIEPVGGRGLDVDVLLEMPYRDAWSPRRYLQEAERALNENCAGAAQRQSRNVRVDFSDTVHVDVIPLVTRPSGEQAIVNYDDDEFQPVDPFGIAEWIDDRDEQSGGSLRPSVRLLKYQQALDRSLPCAPIMLTIMLGEQIRNSEAITRQSGLTDDLRHLVDGLCEQTVAEDRKPRVDDPSRPEVNFDHRWKWGDYQQFRLGIRDYRDNLVKALATDPEATQPQVWGKVFGPEFEKFLASRNPPVAEAAAAPARNTPAQEVDAWSKAFSGAAPASQAVRATTAGTLQPGPSVRRVGDRVPEL